MQGEPPRRALDAVLENEGLMYSIASAQFLALSAEFSNAAHRRQPRRDPQSNVARAVLPVSRSFRRAFGLALAQHQWDHLTRRLTREIEHESDRACSSSLTHRIDYVPRGCAVHPISETYMIPPQGLIVITVSNAWNHMWNLQEGRRFKSSNLPDGLAADPSRETTRTICFVPPRELLHSFAAPIGVANPIAWDARRLFYFMKRTGLVYPEEPFYWHGYCEWLEGEWRMVIDDERMVLSTPSYFVDTQRDMRDRRKGIWVREHASRRLSAAYHVEFARVDGPLRTRDFARKLKELLGARPT